MIVDFLITLGLFTAITVWGLVRNRRERSYAIQLALDSTASPLRPVLPPLLKGMATIDDWQAADDGHDAQGKSIPHARFRFSVVGLLPTWLAFHTSHEDFRASAAFGTAALDSLPPGFDMCAENGDLVIESQQPTPIDPKFPAAAVQCASVLVAAYQQGGLAALELRLRESVREGEPLALKILIERFPHSPESWQLAEAALAGSLPALQLAAALLLGERGEPVIEALAVDRNQSVALQREALSALIERGRWPAVLTVAERASDALERELARALTKVADPRVELLVIPWLASRDEAVVEAVGDLLARRGTRAAVAPLQARLADGDLGSAAVSSIQVALELIKDRIGGGRTGNLALVDADAAAGGQVSIAPATPGSLSPPKPDN